MYILFSLYIFTGRVDISQRRGIGCALTVIPESSE